MLGIASSALDSHDDASLVAGRIKKYETIIDKLNRERTPSDLDRLYDIAGCRVVVADMQALEEYCARLETSRFYDAAKSAKRNYIKLPHRSGSGYRSRHLIFKFDDLSVGHTLFVELQVRTEWQHAWATAAELYDKIAKTRLKFNEFSSPAGRFFRKAAELIKQLEESGDFRARKIRALAYDPEGLATSQKIVNDLKAASRASYLLFDKRPVLGAPPDYYIADFFPSDQELVLYAASEEDAIEDYVRHEGGFMQGDEDGPRDTVLVTGGPIEKLARLYPNYFGDISVFTDLIDKHMPAFA